MKPIKSGIVVNGLLVVVVVVDPLDELEVELPVEVVLSVPVVCRRR